MLAALAALASSAVMMRAVGRAAGPGGGQIGQIFLMGLAAMPSQCRVA
jgi:hypothetical protein